MVDFHKQLKRLCLYVEEPDAGENLLLDKTSLSVWLLLAGRKTLCNKGLNQFARWSCNHNSIRETVKKCTNQGKVLSNHQLFIRLTFWQ